MPKIHVWWTWGLWSNVCVPCSPLWREGKYWLPLQGVAPGTWNVHWEWKREVMTDRGTLQVMVAVAAAIITEQRWQGQFFSFLWGSKRRRAQQGVAEEAFRRVPSSFFPILCGREGKPCLFLLLLLLVVIII